MAGVRSLGGSPPTKARPEFTSARLKLETRETGPTTSHRDYFALSTSVIVDCRGPVHTDTSFPKFVVVAVVGFSLTSLLERFAEDGIDKRSLNKTLSIS